MNHEEIVKAVARVLVPILCGSQEDKWGGDLPDKQFDDLPHDWQNAHLGYARAALSTAEPLIRADERKRTEGEIVEWLNSHPEADEDFGPGFIVAASGVSTGDYRKGDV